jgi:hypothetical protein
VAPEHRWPVDHYRGRAEWIETSSTNRWYLHFDPPLNIPAKTQHSLDLSPPPPIGPKIFTVEIEFERLPRFWRLRQLWMEAGRRRITLRRMFVVVMVYYIVGFLVGTLTAHR